MNKALDSLNDSLNDKYEALADRALTKITITDVSYRRETGVLNIEVQNLGETSLAVGSVNVLLNGLIALSASMSIGGSDTALWLPSETLTIALSQPSMSFSPGSGGRLIASSDARLSAPRNMSVGDEVYVIDGSQIDVFTLSGMFHFTINDPGNITSPRDIKAFGNYLYVLDGGHVDALYKNGSWAGTVVNDPANTPAPIAMAVDAAYIYLVDGNDHIDRYNRSTGAFVDRLVSNGGLLTGPVDICVGSHIFVIDRDGAQANIDRFDLDGTNGTTIVPSGRLSSPGDVSTLASSDGHSMLFVTNDNREVLVFDEQGTLMGTISEGMSDEVRGVDAAGRIYVSDGANGLIVETLGTSLKVVVENGVSDITVI